MKKIILIISVALIGFSIGCKKKDPEVVSKIVEVTLPTIELKGSSSIFVQKGTVYVDSGAILTDDITGVKSNITPTTNLVDVNKEGWYEVNYKAKNKNGFLTNVSRYVLVLDYTPSVNISGNVDLSGTYKRISNGVLCNVIKLAPGLFCNENLGGSSLVYPNYIILKDDSTIDVPEQQYELLTGNEVFDFELESFYETTDPYAFSYKVLNPGFGTAIRKFEKQP
jgi:hypothetical protein